MSDCCYLEMVILSSDREKFDSYLKNRGRKIGDYFDEEEEDGRFLLLKCYEANLAYVNELNEWGKAIDIHGRNGSGGDYDEAEFLVANGEYVEIPTLAGKYCVTYSNGANPDPSSLADLYGYINKLNMLKKKWGIHEGDTTPIG